MKNMETAPIEPTADEIVTQIGRSSPFDAADLRDVANRVRQCALRLITDTVPRDTDLAKDVLKAIRELILDAEMIEDQAEFREGMIDRASRTAVWARNEEQKGA